MQSANLLASGYQLKVFISHLTSLALYIEPLGNKNTGFEVTNDVSILQISQRVLDSILAQDCIPLLPSITIAASGKVKKTGFCLLEVNYMFKIEFGFWHCRKRQNKKQKLFASTSENASDPDQDPVPSAELDWRKFRANLIASERRQEKVDAQSGETQNVSSARKQEDLSNEDDDDVWAHQISAPETGCILFARQSIGNIGFFTNSVILMVRHGKLNNPSYFLKTFSKTQNYLQAFIFFLAHSLCLQEIRI